MSETITLEAVQNAMRVLAENDVAVKDWDGRIYCYEWEVEGMLAFGVDPKYLVIISSELPPSQDQGTDR